MEPQGSGDQFAVQTLRDLREVESVSEVWKTWQNTRDSSLDFFSGLIASRGSGCRPHVLVLRRNGRPDVLLVGLRDHKKIPIRICSVTMCRPEVTFLEFVRGGLLGNASHQNCKALIQAVIRSLAEGNADLALWDQLDVHSALYTSAIQLPNILLRDHCHKLSDHWFLNLPIGLEAFLLSLRPTERSQLRRKYKKFLNTFAGKIQVRCFRKTAEVGQAIREMEGIARKSLKRHLGFGFFDTPETQQQLLVEAAQGWLRIFVLYIDGIPVSFWRGTLYEHCFQTDHVGFDAAWSEFSPGIFLFLKVVEGFCDSDVHTVDLGKGKGQFFESLANVRRPEARVWIFAPRSRGLQLNLQYTLAHYATALIRGTASLNWARRSIWKVRKWRIRQIAAGLPGRESSAHHRAAPYSERQ
jgi:CelD/BcsL family acetyltransferase involved in cellulose biosynthesis